jgi:hypothetical protein
MLIPKRAAANLTEQDVVDIINNKVIDFEALDGIVPKGTPNTWSANAGDRIQFGFKFEWNQTEGAEVVHWHVHGHAPDPSAPGGANASNGWVVRIKRKNRWLLEAPYTPQAPGNPGPQHWGASKGVAAMTHIAVTNQALASKESKEAPEAATRVSGTNIPVNQGLKRRNSLGS